MTLKKLWKIIATKLVWLICWNNKEQPFENVKEAPTKPILIPQPKFKAVEKFKNNYGDTFEIDTVYYDYDSEAWVYGYWYGDEYALIDELELEKRDR